MKKGSGEAGYGATASISWETVKMRYPSVDVQKLFVYNAPSSETRLNLEIKM